MIFGTPQIVTNGLVLHLDAGNRKSYVSGSTVWNDLSGLNNSASLANNPVFVRGDGGTLLFNGTNNSASITETNLTDWSISAWFKYDYTPSNTTILNLPVSSGNKSGVIGWSRGLFQGSSGAVFDTTGSIYLGTGGMGVWDSTERWFGLKLTPSGNLNTNFDIGYTVGSSVTQHATYIGNDGFLYTAGTNLNFFAKRNKETGALISTTTAGGATTVSAYFIIDESQRKVYHMGAYTTAFSLPRNYICKFDLDTLAVDTIFNTSGGLNAQPNQNQIFLTSDKFLYAVGSGISSYKGTPINHIVKIDQSGSLDPNFNPGTGFNSISSELYCAIDSQNRLVCIGRNFTSYSGSAYNRIVRINPNGTADTTFVTPGFTVATNVSDIAIQPDDKILVVGSFSAYSGSAVTNIVRINTNGTLDTTFNTGTGLLPASVALTVDVQPDGKILIGQFNSPTTGSYNGTPFQTFIRLTSSGSIDNTFVTSSGFTDTTSRAAIGVRIRNTAGTLTNQNDVTAWPSLGFRNAPSFYQNAFNRWRHVTYTKDSANNLRMYIDGALVQTLNYSTASFQNFDLQIDRLVSSNNNIGTISIYNRTLTAQEAQQNYNALKSRFGLS